MKITNQSLFIGLIVGALALLTAGYFILNPKAKAKADAASGSSADQHATLTQAGHRDPLEGRKTKASSRERQKRPNELDDLWTQKSQEDLIKAIWAALDEPNEETREQAFLKLIADLHPNDALAVRNVFLDGEEKGRFFFPEWGHFWKKWGEIDGLSAAKYILSDENENMNYPEGAEHMVQNWLEADLEGAKSWVSGLHAEESMRGPIFIDTFITAFAQIDRVAAMDFVNTLEVGEAREFALSALIVEISKQQGVEGIERWMKTLPDQEAIKTVVSGMGSVYENMGEEDSRAWIMAHAADPSRSDEMIEAYSHIVWQDDFGATLDLLVSLPGSPHDDSQPGIINAAAAMADFEPEKFEAWIEAHANHPASDNILVGLAEMEAKRGEFERANTRASAIRNTGLKAKALRIIGSYESE